MPVFYILIDIIELTCYININLKTDTDTNGGSLTEFYYAGTALLKIRHYIYSNLFFKETIIMVVIAVIPKPVVSPKNDLAKVNSN